MVRELRGVCGKRKESMKLLRVNLSGFNHPWRELCNDVDFESPCWSKILMLDYMSEINMQPCCEYLGLTIIHFLVLYCVILVMKLFSFYTFEFIKYIFASWMIIIFDAIFSSSHALGFLIPWQWENPRAIDKCCIRSFKAYRLFKTYTEPFTCK